jgi:hypothetical protein
MIKGVNMKRKFSIIDFAISISFAFLLSFYLLPQGIDFFMAKQDKLPESLKEQMLLAGKTYLEKNIDKEKVTLSELFDDGYLIKEDVTLDKDCFPSISTISKKNGIYHLNLQCVEDNSKLTLLE